MQNEVKAKQKDNGKWIQGYYVYDKKNDLHLIFTNEVLGAINPGSKISNTDYDWQQYEIDENTICHDTGKTDKKGNKVWENDILNGFEYPFLRDGKHNYFAKVSWLDNCSAFVLYTIKNPKSKISGISDGNIALMEGWQSDEWEVIGNIYDNPELLRKEN